MSGFLKFALCAVVSGMMLAPAYAADQELETGIIRGEVQFAGTPPTFPPIKASMDPACEGTSGPVRQDVIVNPNKTLKNVIVYLKSGLPKGKTYPVPTTPFILDQSHCMFEPHVFAIRAGQPLEIRNSDPTIHNVNIIPKINEKSNRTMLNNKVPPITMTFPKPEVGIPLRCDIHPWMKAWCGVFDHPFFTVTGNDGKFEFKDVPDGEYVIESWQERYGFQSDRVTVSKAQPAQVTLIYVNTGARTSNSDDE